jgi:Flp pilus assembly protein TadB
MKLSLTKIGSLFTFIVFFSSCSTYQNLATNWHYRNDYKQPKDVLTQPVENKITHKVATKLVENALFNDIKVDNLLSQAIEKAENNASNTAVASVTISKKSNVKEVVKIARQTKSTNAGSEIQLKAANTKIYPSNQDELKETARRSGLSKFLVISLILMLIGLLVALLLSYLVGIIIFIVGAVIFFYWLFKTL